MIEEELDMKVINGVLSKGYAKLHLDYINRSEEDNEEVNMV